MKHKLQLLFSATTVTAVSALAFNALAVDTPAAKTEAAENSASKPRLTRPGQLHGAAKVSDVIGLTVKNEQDETLGKAEDLSVDLESGRLVEVILSTGSGETFAGVPPSVLHHDVAHKVLHLDASKEKLTDAPGFDMAKWAECCSADHLSAVYHYYGAEQTFNFINKGEVPKADPKAAPAADKDDLSIGYHSMIPVSRLAHLQKATKLMGMPVLNRQDEKLGKVENILVDIAVGRLVAVIISSGGYIGMEDELSAVPPTVLRFSKDWKSLRLDATKASLSEAPHFNTTAWPDFTQPGYAAGMYRAYKQEPYFAPGGTTQADNTARNKDDKALTPMDQGNSKADIATTAQIRKEVMALDDLSLTAKNVKIITNEGKVTLRGPVNTAAEKQSICEIADKIAKAEHVDNQLEVKLASGDKE